MADNYCFSFAPTVYLPLPGGSQSFKTREIPERDYERCRDYLIY